MRSASRRALKARIAIRDRLLFGILGHLRKRDPGFARVVERAVTLVHANDDRILEARVGRDVKAFAQMDLSRGKLKPPGPLREAKLKTWLVEAYIRTAEKDGDRDGELVQKAWRECLNRNVPLNSNQLREVSRAKTVEGKALRLVFFATRGHRRRQERFADFRKQLSRLNIKPHPWIVD